MTFEYVSQLSSCEKGALNQTQNIGIFVIFVFITFLAESKSVYLRLALCSYEPPKNLIINSKVALLDEYEDARSIAQSNEECCNDSFMIFVNNQNNSKTHYNAISRLLDLRKQ